MGEDENLLFSLIVLIGEKMQRVVCSQCPAASPAQPGGLLLGQNVWVLVCWLPLETPPLTGTRAVEKIFIRYLYTTLTFYNLNTKNNPLRFFLFSFHKTRKLRGRMRKELNIVTCKYFYIVSFLKSAFVFPFTLRLANLWAGKEVCVYLTLITLVLESLHRVMVNHNCTFPCQSSVC